MLQEDQEKQQETNVQVAVRCRPLNEREKEHKRTCVVQCKTNTNEIAIIKRKTYAFDKVYGQYSTQKEIFKLSVKSAVDEALSGYNCTVFAYGQTGTGKTHTMLGDLDPDHEESGIIPRCIRYIFDTLQSSHQEYSVKISFLQLYNEELKDLLAADGGKKLRLMDDVRRGGIYCQNLQEITTTTASHVFQLLETGVKNRITSETLMNENSSRSHSIFTIRIHSKEHNPAGEDLLKIGQLNLVDLAGSECVGRSGARNIRAREAGNINQSLLTLGRVITALVDNHPHIPYRDSKLTRLLQESLGGRAKTTIIATLSPGAESMDESLSTLEYAYRARSIKNKPEVNQKMTKHALLKEYGSEIESLRNALEAARHKDGIYLPPAQFDEMQQRLAGQAAQLSELEDQLDIRIKASTEMEEVIENQKLELEKAAKREEELNNFIKTQAKNLDTLEKRTQHLENELDNTRSALHALQKHEQKLIQHGHEMTHLYQIKEKESEQLLEVIARKERVAIANEELIYEYVSKATILSKSFHALLQEQEKKQIAVSEAMHSVINEMKTTQEEKSDDVTHALEDLERTVIQLNELTETHIREEQGLADGNWVDNEAILTFKCKEISDKLQALRKQSLENKNTCLVSLDQTRKHLTSMDLTMTEKIRAMHEDMTVDLTQAQEMLQKTIADVKEVCDKESSCIASMRDDFTDLIRVHESQTRAAVDTMKEQMIRLMESVLQTQKLQNDEQIEKLKANSMRQTTWISKFVNNVSNSMTSSIQNLGNCEKKHNRDTDTFAEDLHASTESISEAMQKCAAIVKQDQRDEIEAVTAIQSSESAFCEDLKKKAKTQHEKWSNLIADFHKNQQLVARQQKTGCKDIGARFESLHCEFSESVGKTISAMQEIHATATNFQAHTLGICEEQSHSIKIFADSKKTDTGSGHTPMKIKPVRLPTFDALMSSSLDSEHCDASRSSLDTCVSHTSDPAVAEKENVDCEQSASLPFEEEALVEPCEKKDEAESHTLKRKMTEAEPAKEHSALGQHTGHLKSTRNITSRFGRKKRPRVVSADNATFRAKSQ